MPIPQHLSPSKRGSSSKNRKRRRAKEERDHSDMGQYHHTYVMKLFDRSVDLAQFEQSTPLYPICRAWMKNQPHSHNLSSQMRSPSPEPPQNGDDDMIYRMPPPVKIKMESSFDGTHVDLRIPEPVPQPDEHLDINQDPKLAPAPEHLLLNHMSRWKAIRHKWKAASQQAEAKFAPSMVLLRDMFDKQIRDQQDQ